jgi:hypothetical protein
MKMKTLSVLSVRSADRRRYCNAWGIATDGRCRAMFLYPKDMRRNISINEAVSYASRALWSIRKNT